MVRVRKKIRPLAGPRGAGRPGTLRENAQGARTLRRLKRFLKFEFEAKARPRSIDLHRRARPRTRIKSLSSSFLQFGTRYPDTGKV